MKQKVAVLGANDKGGYATICFRLLKDKGHIAIPVNPTIQTLDKTPVHKSLASLIDEHVDTLTLYVNPEILKTYTHQIIEMNPGRVIFNPGTESMEVEEELKKAGIKTMQACTLILLNNNQFELGYFSANTDEPTERLSIRESRT
jgi:Predicted CoA-binding protein